MPKLDLSETEYTLLRRALDARQSQLTAEISKAKGPRVTSLYTEKRELERLMEKIRVVPAPIRGGCVNNKVWEGQNWD